MAPKSILFAASALAGAAFVAAQAAPNWQYIPSACADQCSQTIESAYTCQNQFSGNSNQIYGCFCNAYPSDADNCASCLTSNDAGALASLLTSTKTACPEAEQKCFFSCSFDTCPDGDVQCACSADYLANIYNCASCNTANNNAGTTQISDFNALRDSCANQNFTGASQSFTTRALPVATTDGYTAPTLTATGGGAAATGDASDLGSPSGTEAGAGEPTTMSAASRTSMTAAGSAAAGSSSRRAATSSMSGAGASGASGASAASGAAQSATPSNAAGIIGVPALGGLLGLAGAIAALF